MTSETYGELFDVPGADVDTQSPDIFYFPGVPLHGKSPSNPTLVGIIDSGIVKDHPQLAGFVRACKDFSGEGEQDTLGHGTAVALNLLFSNGLSEPPLALLIAKVTDAQGRIRQRSVVDAIEWVTQQGATIVNLSLGFRGDSNTYEPLREAMSKHSNVMFFTAAGNYGIDVDVFPAAFHKDNDNIVSVGATKENGEAAEYSGPGNVYAPGESRFHMAWAYYYEQGQTLARSGQKLAARRAFEHSISILPNAESEFQLGLLDLSENDFADAVTRFSEAIRLNPSLAEAHEMLGTAYFLSGNYQQAEDSLRTSIALYPSQPGSTARLASAHFNLGQTLLKVDRPEEAEGQFKTVKQLMPDYPHLTQALAMAED